MLKQFIELQGEPHYVRVSRKSLIPFLLASREMLYSAGGHIRYENHNPRSIITLMSSMLRNDASKEIKSILGDKWEKVFSSENALLSFLKWLYDEYRDKEKVMEVVHGIQRYFVPVMQGNVLTYDVGYNLRPETLLHSFFPDTKITACFTHMYQDMPLRRAAQSGVSIRTFYSSCPTVSWLVRELYLSETSPSCVGYPPQGVPIMMKDQEQNTQMIHELQANAISFMKDFINIFREDTLWLPMQYTGACLPFEAFLHSPTRRDKVWVKKLNADNEADSGTREFKCYQLWRNLLTEFWTARHHLGWNGRSLGRFLKMVLTDHDDLERFLRKHLKI